MINDRIEAEELVFNREEYGSEAVLDHYFKRNTKMHEYEDHMRRATVQRFRTYMWTRRLADDYEFKHPKNAFHCFMYMLFFWWPWFVSSFVSFTVHRIELKELRLDLSAPEDQCIIVIRRFKNDRELVGKY